ncbi:MAG: hypothetical protein ACRC53_07285 [Plesiomonas sp.]|uniref:hypothetical protein n=1 Tax=Plesiomonas sp. TaxID=2486279 RepID=UPI003F2A6A8C
MPLHYQPFKISLQTLCNTQSVEYQWIRHLDSEGLQKQDIESAILRCLGGDERSAELLRKVALGQLETEQLLHYLSPS